MQKLPTRLIIGFLLAVALFPAAMRAQSSSMEKADELFAAQKWDAAATAYEQAAKENPQNGRAWYRLGLARHNLKQWKEAITAFEHAEENTFAVPTARYNIATCYARMGEKEKAFDSLAKSADAGFTNLKAIQSDDDLNSLRDDPRFKKVAEQVERTALPCKFDPVYQQFDFWVGDWNVTVPGGQQAGTNSIQKIAGGCALLENWTSVSGGSGKSLNYYDASKQKWVQVWADGSGEIIPTEGVFTDGAMRLEGELIDKAGSKSLYRGTWSPLPDGRVHQFLEQSLDGGKTWNTWFDGYYTRTSSGG